MGLWEGQRGRAIGDMAEGPETLLLEDILYLPEPLKLELHEISVLEVRLGKMTHESSYLKAFEAEDLKDFAFVIKTHASHARVDLYVYAEEFPAPFSLP